MSRGFWSLSYDTVVNDDTYSVRLSYVPPFICDFTQDGDADGEDLANFIAAFNSAAGAPNFNPDCDLNEDGAVDQSDLEMFSIGFGFTDLAPCS